jgi:uncharacterized membrane protein YfcA
MSISLIIITLIILFVTHCFGGIVAFGSTLLALPLLLLSGWELRPAVGMLLIAGTAQALHMTWLNWRNADRKELLRILVIAGMGLPIGFLSARFLPQSGLSIALGLILTTAGISRLFEHYSQQQWQPPAWVLKILLFAGGLIHGAFGSGGATLTIYARYALTEKTAFRGTLPIMWVLLNTVILSGLFLDGQIDATVTLTAVIGVPVVFLATWYGHQLAEALSQERFTDVVATLLCIAGIITLIRNIL